jgi:hypothetical protein
MRREKFLLQLQTGLRFDPSRAICSDTLRKAPGPVGALNPPSFPRPFLDSAQLVAGAAGLTLVEEAQGPDSYNAR